MERPVEPLRGALATLRSRWGSAVIRLGDGRPAGAVVDPAVQGALALAPLPDARPETSSADLDARAVISTGFPALDAILGPAGLPREASVVLRGGPSSGKTTLALRCAAEAQGAGDIVAWLDLARSLDPVEAVARGVDLRWLLVIRPADVPQGLALAGSLLSGRCVGLLVVDLPARWPARADEQLRRLVAHARRTAARLIILEPASSTRALQAALMQAGGLRLELERRAWIRLGRDVVGQRTSVAVAKNRYGPPGRSVDLDIHYLPDGERSLAAHRLATVGLAPGGASVARPPGSPSPGPAVPLSPSSRGPRSAGRPTVPVRGRSGPRLVVV